jgi:NAD(P)-dependent dehydrogenase (short-subunit alcohol dehydrogenase family)
VSFDGAELLAPPSRMDLAGSVAVITGGAAGIGLATARELERRRATPWIIDADESALEDASRAAGGPAAGTIHADVRDRAAVADAVRHVRDREGRLDVVIANAGVTPAPATVRTSDPADFDRVMAINLTGAFNTVHPALAALIEARGHAVLVSSAAAFTATPCGAAYAASKAGVEALGRCLRIELAPHGVSVGTVYFGIVDTDMTSATLDRDPLGAELEAMLPLPLRKRLTAEQAARALVDGIERRSARTVTPAAWRPYALMRGAVNLVADHLAVRHARLHRLIGAVESRPTLSSCPVSPRR